MKFQCNYFSLKTYHYEKRLSEKIREKNILGENKPASSEVPSTTRPAVPGKIEKVSKKGIILSRTKKDIGGRRYAASNDDCCVELH